MSRAAGTRASVQSNYFDNFLALYPGQLADFGSERAALGVDGFPAQEDVFVGRGVVQGDSITITANEFNNLPAPFQVRNPQTTSVSANIVGIVVRTEGIDNDASGNPIVCEDYMASVVLTGSGRRVGALASVAITHGQDVYMAVNATNAANIAVGEFHNAAGSGLVQVTGATWYGPANAGEVGIIELG